MRDVKKSIKIIPNEIFDSKVLHGDKNEVLARKINISDKTRFQLKHANSAKLCIEKSLSYQV